MGDSPTCARCSSCRRRRRPQSNKHEFAPRSSSCSSSSLVAGRSSSSSLETRRRLASARAERQRDESRIAIHCRLASPSTRIAIDRRLGLTTADNSQSLSSGIVLLVKCRDKRATLHVQTTIAGISVARIHTCSFERVLQHTARYTKHQLQMLYLTTYR